MTTNAYIFSWDMYGIESIIPITQYEHWDKQQLMNILMDKKRERNPLDSVIRNLILRAKFNTQRHYEIYAVDCSADMDEMYWKERWNDDPQFCADLIRERGYKIYSDRQTKEPVIK